MHRNVDWDQRLRADAEANPGTTIAQAAHRLGEAYRTVLDHCENLERQGVLSIVRLGRIGHLFVPTGRFFDPMVRLAFVQFLLPSNLTVARALAERSGTNVELARRLGWSLRSVQARTKALHKSGLLEQGPGWTWTLRSNVRNVLEDPALGRAVAATSSSSVPTATREEGDVLAVGSDPIEWFRREVCRKQGHTHGMKGELECLLAFYGRHVMKRPEGLTLVDAYVHAFCRRLGHTHDRETELMECIIRTLWLQT